MNFIEEEIHPAGRTFNPGGWCHNLGLPLLDSNDPAGQGLPWKDTAADGGSGDLWAILASGTGAAPGYWSPAAKRERNFEFSLSSPKAFLEPFPQGYVTLIKRQWIMPGSDGD